MPRKGQLIKGKWFKCEVCSKKFWRCTSNIKKWPPKACSRVCQFVRQHKVLAKKAEIRKWYLAGISANGIAKKLNCSHDAVLKVLRKFGVAIRTRSDYYGEMNKNFKGGHITANGYRRISVRGQPTLEHRYVITKLLKRELLRHEHVHHLNGNKTDNRIENLALLTSKVHGMHHAKQFKDFKAMYHSRITELELRLRKFTER